MSEKLIEVEVKFPKGHSIEYHTNQVPRIGESISLDIDETSGLYKVVGVIHKVFKTNTYTGSEVLSYVTVYVE